MTKLQNISEHPSTKAIKSLRKNYMPRIRGLVRFDCIFVFISVKIDTSREKPANDFCS
jgi:hypothetical protein